MSRLAGPCFAAVLLCTALQVAVAEEHVLRLQSGREVRYTLIEPDSSSSALPVAREVLRYLADGDIEMAAAQSNEPLRRRGVLRNYLASVGEDEFKRVFSEYASDATHVVAEAGIGAHRLIIWRLADPADHLAGQHYVMVEGRFRLDDEPSPVRADLQRVLQAYRRKEKGIATERQQP